MNKRIDFLSDGTVNFYENRIINLIVALASLMGLIIFALIIFFFELYKEKGIIIVFCCFMALPQIISIIFFFRRFLKPIIVFIASPKGIEIYRDLKYEKLTWEQINTVVLERDNCLVFETKESKKYNFPIGMLNFESQAVLKEILSKHGFFF